MDKIVDKQLKRISKAEGKLMKDQRDSWIRYRTRPMAQKLDAAVPDPVKRGLETAFYKGFKLVFEKGRPVIEKSVNKEQILRQHEALSDQFAEAPTRRNLKRLNRRAKVAGDFSAAVTAVEGSALGVLGIGLPDIPLFTGMLMRTLQETALSYGIEMDSEAEALYGLLLICAALSENEARRRFNHQILLFEKRLERGEPHGMDLETQIRTTASVLSQTLLTAKFVQGLPLVGVVGGAVNFSVTRRVANFARLKYKKRYFERIKGK